MYGREMQPGDHPSVKEWRERGYGAQWRNRVGMPRLTAHDAAAEASSLLASINAATFRSDPEAAQLLDEARRVTRLLNINLAQTNWALLQVPPKKRGA